jgi:hypothetical protein
MMTADDMREHAIARAQIAWLEANATWKGVMDARREAAHAEQVARDRLNMGTHRDGVRGVQDMAYLRASFDAAAGTLNALNDALHEASRAADIAWAAFKRTKDGAA